MSCACTSTRERDIGLGSVVLKLEMLKVLVWAIGFDTFGVFDTTVLLMFFFFGSVTLSSSPKKQVGVIVWISRRRLEARI